AFAGNDPLGWGLGRSALLGRPMQLSNSPRSQGSAARFDWVPGHPFGVFLRSPHEESDTDATFCKLFVNNFYKWPLAALKVRSFPVRGPEADVPGGPRRAHCRRYIISRGFIIHRR